MAVIGGADNPFSKFYIDKPSLPEIQEAAARHMIAAHKGAKPGKVKWAADITNDAFSTIAAERRAALLPQITELRGKGMAYEAIGAALNVSAGLVKRALREAQGDDADIALEKRRKDVEARAKRNAWIMRQHDAGVCNAAIAKTVGLDRNSVAKIIRQAKGRAKQ